MAGKANTGAHIPPETMFSFGNNAGEIGNNIKLTCLAQTQC